MQYYNEKITDGTNWNGDASTGNLHVRGSRVQEWIKDKVSSIEGRIAPAYSASATYAVGDIVTYEDALYRCIEPIDTAEAWNASRWAATTVADRIPDACFEFSGENEEDDGIQSASGGHATAEFSFAVGELAYATGYASQAFGRSTTASGGYSHVEGMNSKAVGDMSHAEGSGTVANGSLSHAEGGKTVTSNQGEHAEGKFNKSTADVTLHSVGIGTGEGDRKNAEEITTEGKMYILGVGDYDGTNVSDADVEDVASVIEGKLDRSAIYADYTYVTDAVDSTTGAMVTSSAITLSAGQSITIVTPASGMTVKSTTGSGLMQSGNKYTALQPLSVKIYSPSSRVSGTYKLSGSEGVNRIESLESRVTDVESGMDESSATVEKVYEATYTPSGTTTGTASASGYLGSMSGSHSVLVSTSSGTDIYDCGALSAGQTLRLTPAGDSSVFFTYDGELTGTGGTGTVASVSYTDGKLCYTAAAACHFAYFGAGVAMAYEKYTPETNIIGYISRLGFAASTLVEAINIITPSHGSGAPATVPSVIGQLYLDTTARKTYIAYGTSAASDWGEL